MKRIVTLQDISCLGKCSLTVALPVISALGVETCVIPTAVFSTHTMFEAFRSTDLTEDILPIADYWEKEGFKFDAIYTGYLGSFRQIDVISDFIKKFKTDECTVFIDPVMADNGSLYPGFTVEYAKKMAELCSKADIIVPNMTEAAFLLDEEYIAEGYDEAYIKAKLIKLTELGAKIAILTGVSFEEGKLGVMGYDKNKKEFFEYFSRRIPVSYHGTGDIFSSALIGEYVNSHDIAKALKAAVDFTVECISVTYENKDSNWYGVDFEKCLHMLTSK